MPEQSTAQLSAGRELDAAVGRAMKVEPQPPALTFGVNILGADMTEEFYPRVSTDPAACAEAKKWLRDKGYTVRITIFPTGFTTVNAAPYQPFVFGPNIDGATEEEAIARLVLAISEQQKEVEG